MSSEPVAHLATVLLSTTHEDELLAIETKPADYSCRLSSSETCLASWKQKRSKVPPQELQPQAAMWHSNHHPCRFVVVVMLVIAPRVLCDCLQSPRIVHWTAESTQASCIEKPPSLS